MTDSGRKLNLYHPATYQIKVPGRLDKKWQAWFEGMTITTEKGQNGEAISILAGTVRDQAALQGLLKRLYSLGLPLISITLIETDEPRRKR